MRTFETITSRRDGSRTSDSPRFRLAEEKTMAYIDFLDETMRDGQQSLWGLRMQAGMALPVSPLIHRTGFRVIDLTGRGMLDVLTRYCQENYWEGLDLLVASMPRP